MSEWEDEQELVDLDDATVRLSASGIKAHKWCPEQFRLKYAERLPETKLGRGYGELGNAVHDSIEVALRAESEPPRYENQLREAMLSEYRSIEPDVDEELWDRGVQSLETAAIYLSETEEFAGDVTFEGFEEEFEFSLGRVDIQARFTGRIDATSGATIYDWKTGSIREDDEVIQGAIYMRGYQELYDRPPESIRFVYLKEGEERVLEPSDENWQAMLEYAREVVQDVQAESFEPQPDGTACYFCSMEGWCSASPVGAGGIEWEQWKRR